MVLYTPYPDLQLRTYEGAFEELRALKGNVTPDVIFVWSKDRRAPLKLDDWSSPGRLAIPFVFDEENELGLVALLREHLHVRDLFNETTPVSGTTFFGRKTLLQSLRDDVLNQSVSGIFGLRKAGKTSILYELREKLEADNVVSVLIDLEAYPSPPDDPVDDICEDLRRRLMEELRRRGLGVSKLAALPEYPTILQLRNALQALVRKLEQDGYRLLLMLDEIEYLTPAEVDIAEGPMPRISQFLAALRSLVQESPNFTFLLSGLTSAILESGRLYGRPNPLFSWAKLRYVGPLEKPEADRLATYLGARMGIAIDPGALITLYQASGGHAYLYRNLASTVVASLPMEDMQRRITRSAVLRQYDGWATAVRGHVNEMIDHVGRYYPTEGLVLELMRENPKELQDLARDEPQAARRLRNLGVLHTVDGKDELSVLLDLA
ncbi:ATP-binding protein [Herbiconiux daphne]|uniref:ATP-binding protein n=1 Tax=Herbiconiux daphne TaxID=2970914 RepID=A0ABT2H0D4_9MICO|nr:ATP-binding protein [Herbiconiux daphne]MCS5732869.1 ATP-binding protein [Herbiconiux daphne]